MLIFKPKFLHTGRKVINHGFYCLFSYRLQITRICINVSQKFQAVGKYCISNGISYRYQWLFNFSIQLFDNSFNLMILFNVGFQFQASIFILPLTKKNGFTFNRIHSFAFQFTSFVSISPFCFYLNSNSKTMNIKIEDKYNN